MAYFPLFVNLEGKTVLIIGAGEVALRKIEKLLPFNSEIKVVAKKVKIPEIKSLAREGKIILEERPFQWKDLEDVDLVIVATDDIELQKEIYKRCKDKNIPVNSVDSPDFCSFIFPAYVKKKDIVIGITTSGKAPAFSGRLKQMIEDCLPEKLDEILDELATIRQQYPKGEQRQKLIKERLKELLESL